MELRIGIDATNIRRGGGLHHLREILLKSCFLIKRVF